MNEHFALVTRYMAKTRGVFRAWAPVTVETDISKPLALNSFMAFYKSSCAIGPALKGPAPYIDFHLGQIVSLKQNWNPQWYLCNNAKAFVVGLNYMSDAHSLDPLISASEAAERTLQNPSLMRYSLFLKPFHSFNGPSAFSEVPGIFIAPWTKQRRKIMGCNVIIEGPKLFPANSFTHHQSQGSTLGMSVVLIDENYRSYGMSNVVASRTPAPQNFAILEKVNRRILQPCSSVSKIVEAAYKRLMNSSDLRGMCERKLIGVAGPPFRTI